MNTLVVVSTCPRPPGVDYLLKALASYDEQGASELQKVVLSDGLLTGQCPWPSVERTDRPPSARWNLQDSFRVAAEKDMDQLIFLEDDLVPCKNALRRIAKTKIYDDVGFVTFYDFKELPRSGAEWKMYKVPARGFDGQGFWGTQAMLFPKRCIEYLATKDFMSVWTNTNDLPRQGDRVLEEFIAASPWPYFGVHSPSLFRHIGAISATNPDASYGGDMPFVHPGSDDFDALTLPY